MKMHRSFRAALNEPQVATSNKVEALSSWTIRDEDTSEEVTLMLPYNITLLQLKNHVKEQFRFKDSDNCDLIQICYPADGIDQFDHVEKSKLIAVHDEASWKTFCQYWGDGASLRREELLLFYIKEANRIIQAGISEVGVTNVLLAIDRLSNILDVKNNRTSVGRLKVWPLIHSSLITVIETRPESKGQSEVDIARMITVASRSHWSLVDSVDRYRRAQAICPAPVNGQNDDSPTTLPLLAALRWALLALRRRRRSCKISALASKESFVACFTHSEPISAFESVPSQSKAPIAPEESGEWAEKCAASVIDHLCFAALGALWCNMRDPLTRRRHGGLAVAYAAEIAVHGSVLEAEGGSRIETPLRDLAAHMVCFLLVNEPILRAVVVGAGTSTISGLAMLLWHHTDSKAVMGSCPIALCASTILSCLVASRQNRAMFSSEAAEAALIPLLAFASSVTFKHANLGNGNHAGAVNALDHALSAIWGLLLILRSSDVRAKVAGEQSVNVEENNDGDFRLPAKFSALFELMNRPEGVSFAPPIKLHSSAFYEQTKEDVEMNQHSRESHNGKEHGSLKKNTKHASSNANLKTENKSSALKGLKRTAASVPVMMKHGTPTTSANHPRKESEKQDTPPLLPEKSTLLFRIVSLSAKWSQRDAIPKPIHKTGTPQTTKYHHCHHAQMSEVELCASLACLAIVASIDPSAVLIGLGVEGFSRLITISENGGAYFLNKSSEKVVEIAVSAVAHISSVMMTPMPVTPLRFAPASGSVNDSVEDNFNTLAIPSYLLSNDAASIQSSALAGASMFDHDTIAVIQRIKRAQQIVIRVVAKHNVIERLVYLRICSEKDAQWDLCDDDGSFEGTKPTKALTRQQMRIRIAKLSSIASMQLSALMTLSVPPPPLDPSGSVSDALLFILNEMNSGQDLDGQGEVEEVEEIPNETPILNKKLLTQNHNREAVQKAMTQVFRSHDYKDIRSSVARNALDEDEDDDASSDMISMSSPNLPPPGFVPTKSAPTPPPRPFPSFSQSRVQFSGPRIALIAQSLWSQNRSIVAQTSAALWVLCRDSATRRKIVNIVRFSYRKAVIRKRAENLKTENLNWRSKSGDLLQKLASSESDGQRTPVLAHIVDLALFEKNSSLEDQKAKEAQLRRSNSLALFAHLLPDPHENYGLGCVISRLCLVVSRSASGHGDDDGVRAWCLSLLLMLLHDDALRTAVEEAVLPIAVHTFLTYAPFQNNQEGVNDIGRDRLCALACSVLLLFAKDETALQVMRNPPYSVHSSKPSEVKLPYLEEVLFHIALPPHPSCNRLKRISAQLLYILCEPNFESQQPDQNQARQPDFVNTNSPKPSSPLARVNHAAAQSGWGSFPLLRLFVALLAVSNLDKNAQASAFGLHGKRHFMAERDALHMLALHALCYMTAYLGDSARSLAVLLGAHLKCSALLREDDRPSWKRTRPVQLLLNLSACDANRPKICCVALDDLVRATMAREGSHADVEMEVHLAFSTLANLSRHMGCRGLLFRTALVAGILPPGVSSNLNNKRRTKEEEMYEAELQQLKASKVDVSQFSWLANDEQTANNSSEICFTWSNSGRHPLFKLLQMRYHQNGGRVVIPERIQTFKQKSPNTFVSPELSQDLSEFDTEEVSQHVASVVAWMMNSAAAAPPYRAPSRKHVPAPIRSSPSISADPIGLNKSFPNQSFRASSASKAPSPATTARPNSALSQRLGPQKSLRTIPSMNRRPRKSCLRQTIKPSAHRVHTGSIISNNTANTSARSAGCSVALANKSRVYLKVSFSPSPPLVLDLSASSSDNEDQPRYPAGANDWHPEIEQSLQHKPSPQLHMATIVKLKNKSTKLRLRARKEALKAQRLVEPLSPLTAHTSEDDERKLLLKKFSSSLDNHVKVPLIHRVRSAKRKIVKSKQHQRTESYDTIEDDEDSTEDEEEGNTELNDATTPKEGKQYETVIPTATLLANRRKDLRGPISVVLRPASEKGGRFTFPPPGAPEKADKLQVLKQLKSKMTAEQPHNKKQSALMVRIDPLKPDTTSPSSPACPSSPMSPATSSDYGPTFRLTGSAATVAPTPATSPPSTPKVVSSPSNRPNLFVETANFSQSTQQRPKSDGTPNKKRVVEHPTQDSDGKDATEEDEEGSDVGTLQADHEVIDEATLLHDEFPLLDEKQNKWEEFKTKVPKVDIHAPTIVSQRVWMWKHVAGSEISKQAGLTPFHVPLAPDMSSKISSASSSASSFGQSKQSRQTKIKETTSQPYFFFHRGTLSAHCLAPPPLTPPTLPLSLSDLFQTDLPAFQRDSLSTLVSPSGLKIGVWMDIDKETSLLRFVASCSAHPSHQSTTPYITLNDVARFKGHAEEWLSASPPLMKSGVANELVVLRVGNREVKGGLPAQPPVLIVKGPRDVLSPRFNENAHHYVNTGFHHHSLSHHHEAGSPRHQPLSHVDQAFHVKDTFIGNVRSISSGLASHEHHEYLRHHSHHSSKRHTHKSTSGGSVDSHVWSLSHSYIWGEACVGVDSGNYFDSGEVMARAVRRDWRRILGLARFYEMFGDGCDEVMEGHSEFERTKKILGEVEDLLVANCELFLRLFDYYSHLSPPHRPVEFNNSVSFQKQRRPSYLHKQAIGEAWQMNGTLGVDESALTALANDLVIMSTEALDYATPSIGSKKAFSVKKKKNKKLFRRMSQSSFDHSSHRSGEVSCALFESFWKILRDDHVGVGGSPRPPALKRFEFFELLLYCAVHEFCDYEKPNAYPKKTLYKLESFPSALQQWMDYHLQLFSGVVGVLGVSSDAQGVLGRRRHETIASSLFSDSDLFSDKPPMKSSNNASKHNLELSSEQEINGKVSQSLFVPNNTDDWRHRCYYSEDVEKVIIKHQQLIEVMFGYYSTKVYASGIRRQASKQSDFYNHQEGNEDEEEEGVERGDECDMSFHETDFNRSYTKRQLSTASSHSKQLPKAKAFIGRMALASWTQLLLDSGLIGGKKALWGKQLSGKDSRLTFTLSKRVVVDEVKSSSKLTSLDKFGFYEALARCSELLADELPLIMDLEHHMTDNLVDYERKLLEAADDDDDDDDDGDDEDEYGDDAVENEEERKNKTPILTHQETMDWSSDSGNEGEPSDYSSNSSVSLSDSYSYTSSGDTASKILQRGKESKAQGMIEEARHAVKKLNHTADHLDMLLRLIGGRLAVEKHGNLVFAGEAVSFVPAYISESALHLITRQNRF